MTAETLIETLKVLAQAAKEEPVELFLSDIHGEYEESARLINGAGVHIEKLIDKLFTNKLSEKERSILASLVYFPESKFAFLQQQESFQKLTASQKQEILDLVRQVQRGAVSKLYVLGDIYDRGPAPEKVMDMLGKHHNTEIIWGNHDIVWMGAAAGNLACIATVIRICARYGNLSILEDNYGIDLSELREYALEEYELDSCIGYRLKGSPELSYEEIEAQTRVQKAIAIMQYKAEAVLIDENPEFDLEDRKLLDKIDYWHGTITIDGEKYELLDKLFPGLNHESPFTLRTGEKRLFKNLKKQFLACKKLQEHVRILLERGNLYKVVDNLLLFHACVPLEDDGQFKEVKLFGKSYKGKDLFDKIDFYVRQAFSSEDEEERKHGSDLLWYLWLGKGSPLFAKSKMATFEMYYLEEKELHVEEKNAFYKLYEDEQVLACIFEDFGLNPKNARIICGHVPVKVKDGENPIKAGGHLLCIDGGMSKPYRKKTGVAGFCLERFGKKGKAVQPEAGAQSKDDLAAEKQAEGDAIKTQDEAVSIENQHESAKFCLITPTEFAGEKELVEHDIDMKYDQEELSAF